MIRNQTSRGDSYLWDMFNQLMGKIRGRLKSDFAVVLVEGVGSCALADASGAPGLQLSSFPFSSRFVK